MSNIAILKSKICTEAELIQCINEIGFIPLFRNSIPGFSVEEMTKHMNWWSGDPKTDPWQWRETITRGHQIAYGKFFHNKNGFISLKWLPDFVNYRRDGYDFEALWEDEKATYRQKRIMDLFEDCSIELASSDIKERSGFSNGSLKNYEGTLTNLQMQLYLCTSDFRRKISKNGHEYGLSVGAFSTPETLWGYDFITSRYKVSPEQSKENILEHLLHILPDITIESALNLISISGREKFLKEKSVITYPENLLVKLNNFDKENPILVSTTLNADQLQGLEFAINQLKDNEKEILRLRYEENMTFVAISHLLERSVGRIGQIHSKALRKLRNPERNEWYVLGYSIKRALLNKKLEEIQKKMLEKHAYESINKLEQSCYVFLRSYRVAERLKNVGINTVGELCQAMTEPYWYHRVLGVGEKTAMDLATQMYKSGLPEGFGKTKTRSADGVCIVWRSDNPDEIRW